MLPHYFVTDLNMDKQKFFFEKKIKMANSKKKFSKYVHPILNIFRENFTDWSLC